MYVRAVRFTGVTRERMDATAARIRESGGPPPGVPAKGLQVIFDEVQGTAVVIQTFATAQDMDEGARVLAAMDAGETPGTRASVDAGEAIIDLEL